MSELLEYGITTSQADIWVHVCPESSAIYWYRRQLMLKAIKAEHYEVREIPSARGYLVPFSEWFIREIVLPSGMFLRYQWNKADSDDRIGRYAELLVKDVFDSGYMPPYFDVRFLTDKREQLTGVDFEAHQRGYRVECKADIRGGRSGTKNLFVQTHELYHQHSKRNAHLQPGLRVVR